MLGISYAILTVLAWGLWLVPSQNITFKNQQIKTFYVATANLALATFVYILQGSKGLTWEVFWLPFLGGLIWAVSGFLAFTATDRLGMARAYGIWAPINVIVSIIWGAVIFDEFLTADRLTLILLVISLAIILSGILLIIFARGVGKQSQPRRSLWIGLVSALGAGVLWGTYYIPVKLSEASLWVASFPLAIGIFVGSAFLVALTRQPLRLERLSDYARVSATGLLWGIGNYGMLLLVEEIGAARGFTISQLGIVVNGLAGIFFLKDPQPKSRAAALTLAGCLLATLGGIMLGNLK
jgi:glucose uptake protein